VFDKLTILSKQKECGANILYYSAYLGSNMSFAVILMTFLSIVTLC